MMVTVEGERVGVPGDIKQLKFRPVVASLGLPRKALLSGQDVDAVPRGARRV
jgi:hypothetical protein